MALATTGVRWAKRGGHDLVIRRVAAFVRCFAKSERIVTVTVTVVVIIIIIIIVVVVADIVIVGNMSIIRSRS